VVVRAEEPDMEDVVRRLSSHSSYYQGDPRAYEDLVVFDGSLLRCELLPEIGQGDALQVVGLEEFREQWDYWDQLHREYDEESEARRTSRGQSARSHIADGRSEQETTSRAKPGRDEWTRTVCAPPSDSKKVYVVATFTEGGRAETRRDTVVVNMDPPGLGEIVEKLSAHSCYWQSCPAEYADLAVIEGRLVRCELTQVEEQDVKLLTAEEFEGLWLQQEQDIREDGEDLVRRREVRETAAIRHDT
jgi:hypothetical protein